MKHKRNYKIFIMLLFLSLCSAVLSAVPFTPLPVGDSDFNVILMPSSDMSSYEFGFSATPVTQWTTNPSPIDSVLPMTPYFDKTTGKSYATLDANHSLYVYWRMYTLNGITLTLAHGGPMKVTQSKSGDAMLSDDDQLHWMVFWEGTIPEDGGAQTVGLSEKDLRPENAKLDSSNANKQTCVLREFTPNLTLQNAAGCVQLVVRTESLNKKSAVSPFKGKLVLDVTVVE